MSLLTNPADNFPTQTQSPTTTEEKSVAHRERRLDVAAYLVCCGFPCTGYDGCYAFDDPSGQVLELAAGYTTHDTPADTKLYLRAMSDLKRLKSKWDHEHPPPDDEPEDKDGFSQIKHSFWRDRTLSKNAKLVGGSMASHANGSRMSYPGMDVIAAEIHLKKGRITAARQELLDAGYLIKHARHRTDGTFCGWEYEVTTKMVHGRRKKQPKV